MKIVIDHIAKIEGHMGFVGHILKGNVAKAKLEVKEGARLIEGIIIGRNYLDAPLITSRICGVCPVVHNICSLKALEDALNLEVSTGTKILRKLLHDIKFVDKYKKETKKATQIRNFADKLVEIIGGRSIHPTNTKIGGFGRIPNRKELEKLFQQSNKILKNAQELAEIFKNLNYPEFKRKTEFISLSTNNEYGFYEGKINASDIRPISIKKFLPYMVGALARINNNKNQLNPRAKQLAESFFGQDISYNTFYNIFAQAVEVVHFIEEVQKLLKNYLGANYSEKEIIVRSEPTPTKTCFGIGVCEAPRGILFHMYRVDKKGIIRDCNIITPTAQFLQNLEEDLKVFLPDLKKMKEKERKRKIKMIIRAYDPCISCATH